MTPEQVIAEIRARLPDSVPMQSAHVERGLATIGPAKDHTYISRCRGDRWWMRRGLWPDDEEIIVRDTDRFCAAARALGWL